MSIVAVLQKLEHEIVSYADAAGKDVEKIGEEIIAFLTQKKVEAQNTSAAASLNPTPAAPSAVGSTAAGAPGNPTTSGAAGA